MAAANNEFFEALSMLEHERGITAEYLIEKIKAAIVIAVKKNYEVEDDHVMVEIDPNTGKFNVALIQDVVADEDWYDEHSEIGITEAQHIRKSYQVGDRVVTPLKTKDFGRIAAQTAKHVIRQGIREAERSQQLSEIQSRAHDIVQATVTRVDPEKGIVALDLGKGGEAILPRNEQVPGEVYTEGQMLQVYIVDVVASERGPRVMISRTHPGLVKRLFELEVPEIYDGTVEVKAISREAGARTKMAVWSKDANVNPVSACIGPHGDRVAAVVEKLGGEKIDIVKWSEDISEFISAALSPAKVVKVELLPGETRSCRVTVPDQQLSLAIGNKGQNARLCARLTGYNIDIRPESGYYGEEEPKAAEAEKTEDRMEQKKIPARQCIGCLTSRPKKELVRVVRAPSGEISIDPVGKKPGRGAYLCPDAACLAKAKKKKALERCFEQPVPAEVYDALAQQLASVEAEKEADRDGKEA